MKNTRSRRRLENIIFCTTLIINCYIIMIHVLCINVNIMQRLDDVYVLCIPINKYISNRDKYEQHLMYNIIIT
jgi:hypothetical protein